MNQAEIRRPGRSPKSHGRSRAGGRSRMNKAEIRRPGPAARFLLGGADDYSDAAERA
jgi:hypothetical protein